MAGVRAVPRTAKRAPEPIGGSSADFLFYVKRLERFLRVGNNLQVIWLLEFLVNQSRGDPLPPNER